MDTDANEAQGVLVIDIPSTMPPEEATQLLNEQYRRGYYIHRALDRFDGARVFLVAGSKVGSKTTSRCPLQWWSSENSNPGGISIEENAGTLLLWYDRTTLGIATGIPSQVDW